MDNREFVKIGAKVRVSNPKLTLGREACERGKVWGGLLKTAGEANIEMSEPINIRRSTSVRQPLGFVQQSNLARSGPSDREAWVLNGRIQLNLHIWIHCLDFGWENMNSEREN